MAIHICILKRNYVEAVLAGTKTTEARLTRTAMPPFGRIAVGERLFLKASGGPFMATALARSVHAEPDVTPERFDQLRRRFQPSVGGLDVFWDQRRATTRFATFVGLSDVTPLSTGPAYRVANMKAWYVLPESASPLQDVVLNDAALSNNYVTLNHASEALQKSRVTLRLPEGREVVTDLIGRRFRWRGWGSYFRDAGVTSGCRVRFVLEATLTYRVIFLPPPPVLEEPAAMSLPRGSLTA